MNISAQAVIEYFQRDARGEIFKIGSVGDVQSAPDPETVAQPADEAVAVAQPADEAVAAAQPADEAVAGPQRTLKGRR